MAVATLRHQSEFCSVGVDHHVDVVAEDTVESHPQRRAEDVLVLHVPAERGAVEAVEQRDESTVPIGVVKVDAVDATLGEDRGAPLRTLADALQAGRVDQLHVAVEWTQHDQFLVIADGTARAAERTSGSASRTTSSTDGPTVVVLEIER